MSNKPKITVANVKSFLEGNYEYYKQRFSPSPEFLQEQYHYRLHVCKDTCVPNESCDVCQCPPIKKAWVVKSCNNGERFPDLMDKESWEVYKKEHNINIDQILKSHGKEYL